METNILSRDLMNKENRINCFAVVDRVSVKKRAGYYRVILRGEGSQAIVAMFCSIDVSKLSAGKVILLEGNPYKNHDGNKILYVDGYYIVDNEDDAKRLTETILKPEELPESTQFKISSYKKK